MQRRPLNLRGFQMEFPARRREFIMLLGGTAAAWPLGARAQQPALPVIGFLSSAAVGGRVPIAFRKGLTEGGFVEGKNVAIEPRWADGHYDRLPAMAADLVRRQVSLIVASGGLVSARAAKASTATIPILFLAGFDPVKVGLVNSFNRPGGNATGVSVYTAELMGKRLELLRELMPSVRSIALLMNPNTVTADIERKDVEAAARAANLQLLVLNATAESEFDMAFASAVNQHAGALLVGADPFFTTRRAQIVELAARHALPAAYPWREYVEAGGLMSYGPNLQDSYHQIGLYAGRILKGAKPGDLPVQMPRKFELIIKLETAMALGITVPRIMRFRADELID
jgi:putative ABC transport system substrate-binding protein